MKAALNAIFPRIMLETFSMSPSKISFLTSEGIGPYLNTLNSSLFSNHYNKTTNQQVEEQFDIKITFWSEADSAVKLLKLKTY